MVCLIVEVGLGMTSDMTRYACDAHMRFGHAQMYICSMYGRIMDTWPRAQNELKQQMLQQFQVLINENKIKLATKRYSQLRKELDRCQEQEINWVVQKKKKLAKTRAKASNNSSPNDNSNEQ